MPVCFCGACYNRVTIPVEYLGKVVKCPICESNFTAPTRAPPPLTVNLWAKGEIFLGLLAAAAGVVLMTRTSQDVGIIAGGILFMLGGYLALAGTRSHLYQSMNEQTAILIDEIRQSKDKDHQE